MCQIWRSRSSIRINVNNYLCVNFCKLSNHLSLSTRWLGFTFDPHCGKGHASFDHSTGLLQSRNLRYSSDVVCQEKSSHLLHPNFQLQVVTHCWRDDYFSFIAVQMNNQDS